MSAGWLIMRSGPGEAAWNMALDEALLMEVARIGLPIVRLYSWNQAAASFGYFQKYGEVARTTKLRPLVRRCSGGGLVPHDCDWTYSVVFPPAHEWFAWRAEVSYRRMHEWIAGALTRSGLASDLADSCVAGRAGQCFAGHERFDVLLAGRKIAGAAQRRNRQGLLIQGSIQLPDTIGRDAWMEEFMDYGREAFGSDWREAEPDAGIVSVATRLLAGKYGADGYNRRR